MKIPSRFLGAALVGALVLGLGGCSSAKYVDSKGTETVVSLDQINIQDWSQAADKLVADMLVHPSFDASFKGLGKPRAVMAVSRVVNNTQQQVDTDQLVKKIRVTLLNSGKIVTTTTVGLGGAEDPLAKQAAEKQAFMNDTDKSTPQPDYTLSGKLLETRAKAGSTNQVTYTFQLSLTETATGLAIWEGEQEITKQGKKAAVGW